MSGAPNQFQLQISKPSQKPWSTCIQPTILLLQYSCKDPRAKTTQQPNRLKQKGLKKKKKQIIFTPASRIASPQKDLNSFRPAI